MEFLYHGFKTLWIIALICVVYKYNKITYKDYKLRQKQEETNKELAKQIEDLKRIIDGL